MSPSTAPAEGVARSGCHTGALAGIQLSFRDAACCYLFILHSGMKYARMYGA